MPVVLLGGEPFVANPVASAMAEVSPEVRALVPDAERAEALRGLGAKVAVGAADDDDLLDIVLSGAHTVCLLGPSGGWWDPSSHRDVPGDAELVLERARSSRIKRVLAIGPAWASATEPLQTLVEEAGIPFVFLRSNLVYGPGSRLFGMLAVLAQSKPVARVVGPGSQRWAPVFVGDLARIVARADDRAELASGTFGLDGPDAITADGVADILAGRRRSVRRHVTRPVRAGEDGAELGSEAIAELSADIVAGPPSAAEEFGVVLTPLAEGLTKSFPP
jgi:NADH dehydrogenase